VTRAWLDLWRVVRDIWPLVFAFLGCLLAGFAVWLAMRSTASAASSQSPDQQFVAAVHQHVPAVQAKPVAIAGYGHEACADMDAGWTERQLDESGFQPELSSPARHVLVELSAQYLCPQNKERL